MRADNMDTIYSAVLWQLHNNYDTIVESCSTNDKQRISSYKEINGFQFKLTNIYNNVITADSRKFNVKYANDFFKYIIDGNSERVSQNPKAREYLVEFEGRNTQYGPRIHMQLGTMLEELIYDSGSRRGTIMILDQGDQNVFYGKRFGNTSIEYPCTSSLTFSIRDNKLHLVSNMRSQSALMVMPYDIYNWTNLMMYVRDKLLGTYPELECGTLTHQVASLHYYMNEEELVNKVLADYGMLI